MQFLIPDNFRTVLSLLANVHVETGLNVLYDANNVEEFPLSVFLICSFKVQKNHKAFYQEICIIQLHVKEFQVCMSSVIFVFEK